MTDLFADYVDRALAGRSATPAYIVMSAARWDELMCDLLDRAGQLRTRIKTVPFHRYYQAVQVYLDDDEPWFRLMDGQPDEALATNTYNDHRYGAQRTAA